MALNTRIQTRRDTAANWEAKNPVLLEGELIIVTTNAGDTRFKIGDGTKTYTQLPFQDETLYNVLSGKADAVELDSKADADHTHADLATKEDVEAKSQVQIVESDVSEVLPVLKIHRLTQAEYDQKVEDGSLENNAIYLTPDEAIDLSGYVTVEEFAAKEVEIDTLLSDKADSTHDHDSSYDAKGSADSALASAKAYTDNAVSGLTSSSHTHDDIYYTESEVDEKVATINKSIDNLATELELYADTGDETTLASSKAYTDSAISELANSSHTHDDIYYTESEIDSKVSTINKSIDNLATEMESYADTGDETTLASSKAYVDNAVAQKSQVQIITWEADD